MDINEIMKKIFSGDIEAVKIFITEHPDEINQTDSDGKTCLMTACKWGYTDLINLLIDSGAHLDTRDNIYRRTALHYAVSGRQLQAVTILKSRGSDVNVKDRYGDTPLHLAAWRGKECKDIVATLLQTKGESVLEVNQRDDFGRTPLHNACLSSQTDTVGLLLNHVGIDVNVVDDHGNTPLHFAVHFQRSDVVTLILSQDSLKLEVKNDDNRTPLLEAVIQGHLGIMQKLITKGAKINAVDNEGNNCLHLSIKRNVFHSEEEHIDLLDECCNELRTEKRLSGVAIANYLARLGGDFHCKNTDCFTPLDLLQKADLKEKFKRAFPLQCVFCEDEVATEKFLPCKHLLLCKKCSPRKMPKRCPMCGQNITSKSSLVGRQSSKREVQVLADSVVSQMFEDKGVQTDPLSSQSTSQQGESVNLGEEHLHSVAKNLGSKWQQLGRELRIKQVDLDVIKYNYSNDVVEQSFQMLYKWFTSCDPPKRTLGTLKDALNKTECFDALEHLSIDVN
ncbi:E3 ubiquitin-protein ligase MIB1-like [Octopus sinensis]|uniref:E3 ubiquitin-protein ligase MIB1-like n=1 Tax=Octopus sinensis TaxID=2607531 RepID=A0A6P7TT52_9MOLL|nr:E3 ubiquitin-protein ligase MIB1-like [Octopus sinensis]XP_036370299.1 E3 ubiquitin-protein ligase MIB1-like [Octopus sinensis]